MTAGEVILRLRAYECRIWLDEQCILRITSGSAGKPPDWLIREVSEHWWEIAQALAASQDEQLREWRQAALGIPAGTLYQYDDDRTVTPDSEPRSKET